MRNIVISGATGMIGEALVRCALQHNMNVLCIVRPESMRFDRLPKSDNLRLIKAGLSVYSSLEISNLDYDAFFHLAWNKTNGVERDDTCIQTENIRYTLDAVYLARRLGCNVFIGAGSQAEYGLVTEPLRSDTPVNPQSGYGIAKYAAGRLSKLLCEQINIRHCWARILSIYGFNDTPYSLISYTIKELQAGHTPEFTKCEQIWDYLYAEDTAEALLAIAQKGVHGKAYPVGSGNPRTLKQYISAIRDIVRPGAKLSFGIKAYYPHQPMYLCADITELTHDTGWWPKFSFEEGIKRIV